jgi:hypothetical protein
MMNEIVNVFDLDVFSLIGHNFPITEMKDLANPYRTNQLFSDHELSPA